MKKQNTMVVQNYCLREILFYKRLIHEDIITIKTNKLAKKWQKTFTARIANSKKQLKEYQYALNVLISHK